MFWTGRVRRNGGGRGAASSCPLADGTQIGTTQRFSVVCDAAIDGDIIEKTTAASLLDCTKLCTNSPQRCDAVTFASGAQGIRGRDRRASAGSACFLKTNITQPRKDGPDGVDTAVAIFSQLSSDCNSLNQNISQAGVSFGLVCGTFFPGDELSKSFASSFQNCMNQCGSTDGCAALSFDAGQVNGFRNCHLKASAPANGSSNNVTKSGFDSAIVQKDAVHQDAAVSGLGGANGAIVATMTSSPGMPLSTTAGVAGVSISGAGLPPADASATAAPEVSTIVSISTETVVTTIVTSFDGSSQAVTRTEEVGVLQSSVFSAPATPAAATSAITAANGTGHGNGTDFHGGFGGAFSGSSLVDSHPAVVAAPVVGGIVSILIIVLLIVMRRKQQQRTRNTRLLMLSKVASNGNDGASSDAASETASDDGVRRAGTSVGTSAAGRGPSPPRFETWSWLPGMWGRRTEPSWSGDVKMAGSGVGLEATRQARESRERATGSHSWRKSWRERLRPRMMMMGGSSTAGAPPGMPDEREIGTWMTVQAGANGPVRTYRLAPDTPVFEVRAGKVARRGGDGMFQAL